jgi:hypothetical protein
MTAFVSILNAVRFRFVSHIHESSNTFVAFSFPVSFSSFPVSHLYRENEKRSAFLLANGTSGSRWRTNNRRKEN